MGLVSLPRHTQEGPDVTVKIEDIHEIRDESVNEIMFKRRDY